MANRTITVELKANVSDEDYAKMANAIWSVASLDRRNFVYVHRDSKADPQYLNDWYDKEDGANRWT